MSGLMLAHSLARAERRFARSTRRRRSDAGRGRLHPAVEEHLTALLAAQEHPVVLDVWRATCAWCARRRLRAPSRASVYNALGRVEVPAFEARDLPLPVRVCLHNVGPSAIPGDQIVVAAFNQGDTRALSFAAAMGWSCLYRASRSRSLRPKSGALLHAVMAYRRIPRAPAP